MFQPMLSYQAVALGPVFLPVAVAVFLTFTSIDWMKSTPVLAHSQGVIEMILIVANLRLYPGNG